ncbi:mitochondrial outer membrane import complex protein METAXIN-like [Pyrus x bretschneideri]|uniref:mitochondrial outer membrane import complex protein METAXIN-like n=1 Tax=Pyrus x bretschneideri TaxID=225117 RepID=UPI00202F53AB|nr:mitochondrial outer membrane import complex protein METAXIN-like [Pyrus x bretschneideri]
MEDYTLVARKSCFGLPTACPSCLTVYFYLKFAKVPFRLDFNLTYPDSDKIPYIESGEYVIYNNEKGGIIERLKEDRIADLDTEFHTIPEWISTKAMISSWISDALTYELWVGTDGCSAKEIYYSDLPWPIGKILFYKKFYTVKQQLGITNDSAEKVEEHIYRRASLAFGALSRRLEEKKFLFEDRPSSLDAVFLGQALITLQALPETSVLQSKLLEHENLVKYADRLKVEFVDSGSPSSVPNFHRNSSSAAPRRGPSNSSSKPKSKPKREETKEEKSFKRRARYFLTAQLVSVVLFVTLLSRVDEADVEVDDDGYE